MNEKKQSSGVSLSVEFTRKEWDLLAAVAAHDKREFAAEVRWIVEAYALGKMKFVDDGTRPIPQRQSGAEVLYPDNVSVGTPLKDGER